MVPVDAETLSRLAQTLGWSTERLPARSSAWADVFRQVDDSEPGKLEPCSELELGPGEWVPMRVRVAATADQAGIRGVAVVQRGEGGETGQAEGTRKGGRKELSPTAIVHR